MDIMGTQALAGDILIMVLTGALILTMVEDTLLMFGISVRVLQV